MNNSGADGIRSKTLADIEIVPADRHHGCQLQEYGAFGTSPSFRQLFGQATACLHTQTMGVPEAKNKRSHPLLCYGERLIHLFRASYGRFRHNG